MVRQRVAPPGAIPHSCVAYFVNAVVIALYPMNQSATDASRNARLFLTGLGRASLFVSVFSTARFSSGCASSYSLTGITSRFSLTVKKRTTTDMTITPAIIANIGR